MRDGGCGESLRTGGASRPATLGLESVHGSWEVCLCFSATANFVGSGLLGAIGVATLREVKHRRELLFAAVPCLFALHQFTEGIVWLGLDHKLGSMAAHDAAAAYLLYAQGLLPFLLPLSVYLIEPTAYRRRRMLGFVALGTLLGLYMLRIPGHVNIRSGVM